MKKGANIPKNISEYKIRKGNYKWDFMTEDTIVFSILYKGRYIVHFDGMEIPIEKKDYLDGFTDIGIQFLQKIVQ